MFHDATSLFHRNPTQRNYGVAVADILGRGYCDLLVAGYSGRNLVMEWDGGRFVEVDAPAISDPDRQAIGIAAGDVDGDGCEEVYVLNTDTYAGRKCFADRLYMQNERGWENLFDRAQNQDTCTLTAGRSIACIDRTGNGTYGFFVANYDGPMRLYEVRDGGRVRDVAVSAGVGLTTAGRGVVSLPIMTSHMDVFCANENGPNFLFENQGDGTFEETAAQRGVSDAHEDGRGVDSIDLGSTIRLGLVYGNWEGEHRMFAPQDGGAFHDVTPSAMATPSRVRTVIAADFDNDGYQEVFFNNIGEANRLFTQNEGVWAEVDAGDATEPRGLGTGAAVADFDDDGRLELVIAHGESGAQPLTLYRPPGDTGNHFLRIAPRTQHGAPARGAIVTCTSEGRTQHRNVDAGSGYLCQMEPVAHFGLGAATTAETVEVRWPDGSSRTLDAPAVDEMHEVAHP